MPNPSPSLKGLERWRAENTRDTRTVAVRLPVDLVERLDRLQGTRTGHIEAAVREYLKGVD
jgi:hypothetical protein